MVDVRTPMAVLAAVVLTAWRGDGPAGDVTVRDQTAYAIGLPQRAAPGEWVYDNAAPQVLERV